MRMEGDRRIVDDYNVLFYLFHYIGNFNRKTKKTPFKEQY